MRLWQPSFALGGLGPIRKWGDVSVAACLTQVVERPSWQAVSDRLFFFHDWEEKYNLLLVGFLDFVISRIVLRGIIVMVKSGYRSIDIKVGDRSKHHR